MKRYIITAVIMAVVLAGAVIYMSATTSETRDDTAHTEPESSDVTGSDNNNYPAYVEGANLGEVVDATGRSEFEITIDDNIFKQTVVTVSRGTTVTWVNNGNIRHNVVSDDSSPKKGLDGPLLDSGETYSHTFDEAGTYNYFCQPHPFDMKAVIEVVE